MKKIYSFAFAALLAFSASATKPLVLKTGEVNRQVAENTRFTENGRFMHSAAELNSLKRISPKAHDEATGKWTIDGEYEALLGDFYFQSSVGEITQDLTITDKGDGKVVVDSPYFVSSLSAEFNSEENTLTFTAIPLGLQQIQTGENVYQEYYVRFECVQWVWTDPENNKGTFNKLDEIVGSFDPETGVVTFGSDMAFRWACYSDARYSAAKLVGNLDIFDVISFTQIDPNADPNEGWTSIGNATIQDGWVLPCFVENPADNLYEVEMQQNDLDKNIYRLVDPYKGNCPVARYNSSTKTGYIQFNVTYPDKVFFYAVEAGFANSQTGIQKMYCMDTFTAFCGLKGYDPLQVIPLLNNSEGEDKNVYTTYKDGVVTCPRYYNEEIDEETNEPYGWSNVACFGYNTKQYAYTGWVDNDNNPADMTVKIYFPGVYGGVDDVVADSDNAVKEYFNLQGVKVANPVAGSLYIVKQGDKASKVIFK